MLIIRLVSNVKILLAAQIAAESHGTGEVLGPAARGASDDIFARWLADRRHK